MGEGEVIQWVSHEKQQETPTKTRGEGSPEFLRSDVLFPPEAPPFWNEEPSRSGRRPGQFSVEVRSVSAQ